MRSNTIEKEPNMIPAKELRERARISLNRNIFGRTWLMLIGCAVVAALVTGIPSLISALTPYLPTWLGALLGLPLFLLSILVSGPISYAMARIYLNVARGDKDIKIKDVFVGFKENLIESAILGFMRSFFIFLWALLLIIPGIIKAYAYSMSFYILQESKGKKTWKACLDESQFMMNGYKGKLFLLDLTFIGWYILGYLCLGIGLLWVNAYHQEARAHFYEELKAAKYGSSDEDYGMVTKDMLYSKDGDDVYDYGKAEDDDSLTDDDIYDYGSDEKDHPSDDE